MRNCLLLLISLVLLGCERETDFMPETSYQKQIVVEATLTNEPRNHKVCLRYTTSHPNDLPEPVSQAAVVVFDADTTWQLTEWPEASGNYYTPAYATPREGLTYTLLITKNGQSITAKALVTKPLEFIRMRYTSTTDSLYKIQAVASPYNPNRPALYEIWLNWSFLPAYKHLPEEQCQARVCYYTLPTLDVSEVLAPESEVVKFPAGTLVVQRRLSLSDEHAAFYRALLLNTTWTGGLFNSAPGSLPTNLSNGATGFFGACGVTSRIFFVLPTSSNDN